MCERSLQVFASRWICGGAYDLSIRIQERRLIGNTVRPDSSATLEGQTTEPRVNLMCIHPHGFPGRQNSFRELKRRPTICAIEEYPAGQVCIDCTSIEDLNILIRLCSGCLPVKEDANDFYVYDSRCGQRSWSKFDWNCNNRRWRWRWQ